MDLTARLDRLQDRLTEGLRHLPGATSLYLFGSRSVGQADPYADIDLQVHSVDLPAARAVWPQFLEHVGPIEVAWPVRSAADNTVFTILFRDESYYHKVDIGLSDGETPVSVTTATTPPVQLWSQQATASTWPSPKTEAYVPASGAIGHLVMDELIASVRYIKARKRGHSLTCWRFLRSKPDRLLQLMAEQAHRWNPRESPLTTWDYRALDEAIGSDERTQLVQHLNCSDPQAMDHGCYWFTRRIVQLAQQKARTQNEPIPEDIIDRHLSFVRTELDLSEG